MRRNIPHCCLFFSLHSLIAILGRSSLVICQKCKNKSSKIELNWNWLEQGKEHLNFKWIFYYFVLIYKGYYFMTKGLSCNNKKLIKKKSHRVVFWNFFLTRYSTWNISSLKRKKATWRIKLPWGLKLQKLNLRGVRKRRVNCNHDVGKHTREGLFAVNCGQGV